MIIDDETNVLFLSDQLSNRAAFYSELTNILKRVGIKHRLLKGSKDIWCRDYMPVQRSVNSFIQFTYNPSYLQTPEFIDTITDVNSVCNSIGIFPLRSKIKIDGGNVIKGKDWVILTDRIFTENISFSRKNLLKEIETLFEAKPIIIPCEPGDYLGHSDGVVRYYCEDVLLINRYRPKDRPGFQKQVKAVLKNEGFKLIEIPYYPYDNDDYDAAHGYYINFLHMKNLLLIPFFNDDHDDDAIRLFQELYTDCVIEVIDSREIASDGGVLNCISWNIKIPSLSSCT